MENVSERFIKSVTQKAPQTGGLRIRLCISGQIIEIVKPGVESLDDVQKLMVGRRTFLPSEIVGGSARKGLIACVIDFNQSWCSFILSG